MNEIDINHFSNVARSASIVGGKVLKKYFGQPNTEIKADTKADKSIVTQADREAEVSIIDLLRQNFPLCSFFAEEGYGFDHSDARFQVLVDPLDGTSNFYRSREGYGISVALVDRHKNRRVVFVSTFEPSTHRLWSAALGKGCYLETIGKHEPRTVCVSDRRPEHGELILDASTSPRKTFSSAEHKANIVKAVLPTYKRFRMTGSNVLAHALVANGSFEAAVTDTVGEPFDIAGHLLVEEAGGQASNLEGSSVNIFTDNITVSSNGHGHNELLSVLQAAYHDKN